MARRKRFDELEVGDVILVRLGAPTYERITSIEASQFEVHVTHTGGTTTREPHETIEVL
jgi:hypothetical protein